MRSVTRARILGLALAATLLSAPQQAKPAAAGRQWSPVPPEQLSLARPMVEPDADAEALLWSVDVVDEVDPGGLVSQRDHFLRVKVFTPEGAQNWSKHDIDYPQNGVRISDLAARTILPDGTVRTMERGAISDAVIVKSSTGSIRRTSFALPGVVPGCIVEFRYRELRRDNDAYASSYLFQLPIPVFKVLYRIKPLSLPGLKMRQLTFHVDAQTSDVPSGGFYETVAYKQRAFEAEPDMPPQAQALGFMVLFYTTSAEDSPETYWPAVGRRQAAWFDEAAKPSESMRNLARELVAGARTDFERVERLARWVRDVFRVVRSNSSDSLRAHGLRVPSDARAAWSQRGGRHFDGLLVFGSMARAVGLPTRWLMVPTRSELFFNRSMLSEGFLDSYQIVIRCDGRWLTFDPLTKDLPWDMLPWDEEAAMALLCDKDSTTFVETAIAAPDRTVQTRAADLELGPDGTLEGTLRVSWTGHLNHDYREVFTELERGTLDSVATWTQSLEGGTTRLSQVHMLPAAGDADPLGISARVLLPEHATVTGTGILLEPAVFHARGKPRYTGSDRRHPVYYRFAWSEVDSIRIRIPPGWRIDDPGSIGPLAAEGVAEYAARVVVSEDRRELLYLRRFSMGLNGAIYFPPKYYPAIKKLFDGIHERDRFTLALTKSETKP